MGKHLFTEIKTTLKSTGSDITLVGKVELETVRKLCTCRLANIRNNSLIGINHCS